MVTAVAVAALGCAVGGAAVGPALAATAARVPGVSRGPGRTVLACVLAAVAFGGVAVRLLPDPAWRYGLPAYLVLAGTGVVLGLVDADTCRLPNEITLPAYVVVAALLVPASLVGAAPVGWAGLVRAAVGAALATAVYLLPALPARAPLGFGDVKLAGLLGLALAWLSWSDLALGIALGIVYGAAHGAAAMAVRRTGRRTVFPFGPGMLAGAFTAILVGNQLAAAYWRW
jgi:leader peptidase (prepilin peptidase) / N-methyltransferase